MSDQSRMTRLADLLPRALQHFNVASGVQAAQVVNHWAAIARDVAQIQNPEDAKALHVKNGTLTIAVRNSTLAQVIQLAKPQLISALNQSLPESRVNDIRCVQC